MSSADDEMTVYHGSKIIVERPLFGAGKRENDYGQGFYTTRDLLMAGEWAVMPEGSDGWISEYTIDTRKLKILNMDVESFLSWIAVLIKNRRVNFEFDEEKENAERFIAKYAINLDGYDIVEGWRANDAYFKYVRAFVSGALSLEGIAQAVKLGNLGKQVFIKSESAFAHTRFVTAHRAASTDYFKQAESRDRKARGAYRSMRASAGKLTRIFDLI